IPIPRAGATLWPSSKRAWSKQENRNERSSTRTTWLSSWVLVCIRALESLNLAEHGRLKRIASSDPREHDSDDRDGTQEGCGEREGVRDGTRVRRRPASEIEEDAGQGKAEGGAYSAGHVQYA